MTVRCWYISNICHTQTLFPTENTADAGLFIILTDLLDPGDRLPALRDPVDEGGRGGAGLVLPSLPHKLPHRDHPGHRDASQGWTFFVNSSLLCSSYPLTASSPPKKKFCSNIFRRKFHDILLWRRPQQHWGAARPPTSAAPPPAPL